MEKYSGIAMDTAGNTLADATITVYLAGTTTLAYIFSDNTFTPYGNPATAAADGTYFFYGHGRFDILVTKDGFAFRPAQTSDLFLYDPMATLSFAAATQQDDYTPLNGAYVSTWRLTATAPFTITGIAAGFAGQRLTIANVTAGAGTITLTNESVASVAANRFALSGDFVLTAGQTVDLAYDAVSARWRITGMTAATTTTVSTGTVGLYRSINLTGSNNAATPLTAYDFAADLVQGLNPLDATTTIWTAATATVDISVVGPAANGRDQAGSFTVDSWIHAYWIGKADGTKAGIFSATAPPTGPTLPATYTHWAYIGAMRVNGATQLSRVTLRGSEIHYANPTSVVTDGRATVETFVDCATLVPPNALTFTIHAEGASGGNTAKVSLGYLTGLTYDTTITTGVVTENIRMALTLPNVGQQFWYLYSSDPTATAGLYATLLAYRNPNGAA